jgi:hypothetical protein
MFMYLPLKLFFSGTWNSYRFPKGWKPNSTEGRSGNHHHDWLQHQGWHRHDLHELQKTARGHQA